jgi:hypothetical protein
MCANCGFPLAPGHWTETGSVSASDRLRARFRRAQVLRSVLPVVGLTAYDDGQTPGVQVLNMTGDQTMAGNLDEVWQATERMIGRPFDPLDPSFISRPDE